MQYKSFPTSRTWVASLEYAEYAKKVTEEKKYLIKKELVQVHQFSITTDNSTEAHQPKKCLYQSVPGRRTSESRSYQNQRIAPNKERS